MIKNLIEIEEALNLTNTIFIDVRSEKEFSEANIPGSINIPILKNEERVAVGRLYRKGSIEEAKTLGLAYASYKLEEIYRKILDLRKKHDNIIVYCWRGGMRSKSVFNMLNTLSIKDVYQLIGGYKAYRKFVFNFLEKNIKNYRFIVLHGLTGVGKTIIIKKLKETMVPTLDFERLAKNSGSVFGRIFFEGNAPSQKQFEALLFHNLYYNDKGFVIVESESKRIGSVKLPDSVIEAMEKGYHILIKTNLENRIKNIHNDYVKKDININDKLIKGVKHLNKRLGNKTIDMLIDKINKEEYNFVIQFLIKNYYDPLYKYSIDKLHKFHLSIEYHRIDDAVKLIEDFIKEKL